MPTKRKPAKKADTKVVNQANELSQLEDIASLQRILNGLQEAILGFTTPGQGDAVAQADTLFNSMRWYYISNFRQLISESYVEYGLVRTIVDVPVNDALRGGVEIKSRQLSPDELDKLRKKIRAHGVLNRVVGRAHKWKRLYGGAGIIIMTDQDPSTPLDRKAIVKGSPISFKACDMWELFSDRQNLDSNTKPSPNELVDALDDPRMEHYNFYGQKVHKTRVMKMIGAPAPSFTRARLRGWGLSIIEPLARSINQFIKSTNLTFEVLDEFKIDVFKFKGLAQTLMAADGGNKVRNRVQTANSAKNYLNSIVLDGEDGYEQKQLSFTGISDVLKGIREQIACDMRMPLTKIFGVSSAGFNSGEDDIENYNAMVEGEIREEMAPEIVEILRLICLSEFGYEPEDLEIEFKPLRVLSSEQQENVKTQQFNRLLAAAEAHRITQAQFIQACNTAKLFPIEVDEAEIPEPIEQAQPEAAKAPEASGSSGLDAPEAKG